jgi:hypothetical protein
MISCIVLSYAGWTSSIFLMVWIKDLAFFSKWINDWMASVLRKIIKITHLSNRYYKQKHLLFCISLNSKSPMVGRIISISQRREPGHKRLE